MKFYFGRNSYFFNPSMQYVWPFFNMWHETVNFVSGQTLNCLREITRNETNFECIFTAVITAWKVTKYGVFSGSFFLVFALNTEFTEKISVFSPNTGKYRPEKTPNLDTFHAVHFDRNDISLRVIKCYVNTNSKWNHMKGNICA